MTALLALLPSVAVIVAVLWWRQSGVVAAAVALAVAAVIWLSGAFHDAGAQQLAHAAGDSIVLLCLVGAVVVGGLTFVEVSSRCGAVETLIGLTARLDLPRPRAVIFVAVGVGITIESLTGYGVSMLVTVPLLLALVDRRRAILCALIGMSLMPWGALSVSALLGAELAGLAVEQLADAYLTTSGPIALLLPLACVLATGEPIRSHLGFAGACGLALLGGVAITSWAVGVEVAGVGGGLAVTGVCLLSRTGTVATVRAFMVLPLAPYALLLGSVIVQKLLVEHLGMGAGLLVLRTERVAFDVLTSPGLALVFSAVVALSWQLPGEAQPLVPRVWQRSWRALCAIVLFLLTARLLMEAGAVSELATLMSGLGILAAVVAVTLLGGLGAYVTGSGVTANALFMPAAAETGYHFGAVELFAALQQSGSGHTAMASLPVIAIALAALPDRRTEDEPVAVRAGLKLAAIWLAMVTASGLVQVLWG